MSARPDSWMKMYWGDYARDTGHLNAAGHGAYLMLIKHYWCSGEPLRDDDEELWRIACCDSQKEWMGLRPKIVRMFAQEDGFLRHKRIDKEISTAQANVSAKAEAGKKGAEKRWQKDGSAIAEPSPANGKPMDPPKQDHDFANAASEPESDKKEVTSLRSVTTPPVATSKPPADPNGPKTILWNEGRAILARMERKAVKDVSKQVGRLVEIARLPDKSVDYLMILDVMREAEKVERMDPYAWITGAIKSRLAPPGLFNEGTPDPYGIRAWIARQPDAKPEKFNGEMVACINGYAIEFHADQIAMAVGLPETWRGSWDALGAWMREDQPMLDPTTLREIGSFARSLTGNITSIKIFDSIVRGGQRAA